MLKGGTLKPLFLQGNALQVTNITNLFLSLRRGFEPLSKSLANR